MSLNQRKLKYLINKADSLGNQYMVLYLLGKKKSITWFSDWMHVNYGTTYQFYWQINKKIVNALLTYFGKISASDFLTGTKFGRNVCRYEDTFLKVGILIRYYFYILMKFPTCKFQTDSIYFSGFLRKKGLKRAKWGCRWTPKWKLF